MDFQDFFWNQVVFGKFIVLGVVIQIQIYFFCIIQKIVLFIGRVNVVNVFVVVRNYVLVDFLVFYFFVYLCDMFGEFMIVNGVKFVGFVVNVIVFYICVVDCCCFDFDNYVFWIVYWFWDINYFVVVKGFVKFCQCFYCIFFCVWCVLMFIIFNYKIFKVNDKFLKYR